MTATQNSRKDTKDEPVDMSILWLGIGWVLVVLAFLMAVLAVIGIFVEGWSEALGTASYAGFIAVSGLLCITFARPRVKARGLAKGDDKPALSAGPNWNVGLAFLFFFLATVLGVVYMGWLGVSPGTGFDGSKQATEDVLGTLMFTFSGLGWVFSIRASRKPPSGKAKADDTSGAQSRST